MPIILRLSIAPDENARGRNFMALYRNDVRLTRVICVYQKCSRLFHCRTNRELNNTYNEAVGGADFLRFLRI